MNESSGSRSHKNTQSAPWTFPTGLCKHSRQANSHVPPPFTSRQKQPVCYPCYYGCRHAEPFRQLFLRVCVLLLFAMLCFPAGGGSDLERMQWKGRTVAAVKPAGLGLKWKCGANKGDANWTTSQHVVTNTQTVRSFLLQSVEINNITITLKGTHAPLLTTQLKHYHWHSLIKTAWYLIISTV